MLIEVLTFICMIELFGVELYKTFKLYLLLSSFKLVIGLPIYYEILYISKLYKYYHFLYSIYINVLYQMSTIRS